MANGKKEKTAASFHSTTQAVIYGLSFVEVIRGMPVNEQLNYGLEVKGDLVGWIGAFLRQPYDMPQARDGGEEFEVRIISREDRSNEQLEALESDVKVLYRAYLREEDGYSR